MSVRELTTESLVLALKERVRADAPLRWLRSLHPFSETRPPLEVKESVSVDVALDEVIAQFPKTMDYLAK
jgi:hypothetical protein